MSYILDALKKSEAERERSRGPTFIDLQLAGPKRRLPWWVLALMLILLINAAVLMVVLLRPKAALSPPLVSDVTAPSASSVADTANALPPPTLPSPTLPPSTLPPSTLRDEPPQFIPAPDAVAATPPTAAVVIEPTTNGSVVTAPTVTIAPTSLSASTATAGSALSAEQVAALPSAADLRNSGISLPELNLSLHVFDAVASRRYVLINSTRLREGDRLPDGIRVLQITEQGAAMDHAGRTFFLSSGAQ